MATVGEVIERLSLLKSRIAIRKQVALYLQTQFLSSDASAPESRIQRDDNAIVSEEHLQSYAADLDIALQQDEAELKQWEQLLVVDPTDAAEKKEKKRGPARERGDQSAAE